MSRIAAVSHEAVELPDNHKVKQFLVRIFYHLLKLRPVVAFAGHRAVYISVQGSNALRFGKRLA
jgi:hypothetical protein